MPETSQILNPSLFFRNNTSSNIAGKYFYDYESTMPESCKNGNDYRFGFQGQEADNEIKGDGNSINYKYRVHDPRLGRFLSIDPLSAKYPFYSPYAFSGNRVIDMVELEGLEPADPPTEDGVISQALLQGSDNGVTGNWVGVNGKWEYSAVSSTPEIKDTRWDWSKFGTVLYNNDDLYKRLMNSDRPIEVKLQISQARFEAGRNEWGKGILVLGGGIISSTLLFAGGALTATASASWLMRGGSGAINWGGQFGANLFKGQSWANASFKNINWTSVGMSTFLAKPSFGNFLFIGAVSSSFNLQINGSRTILNGDVQADEVAFNTGLNVAFSYAVWGLSSLRSSFNYTNFLYMRNLDGFNPMYHTLSKQVMNVTLTTKSLGFGLGVTNNYFSK